MDHSNKPSCWTVCLQPGPAAGTIEIPPSKSIGHRALICAAMASGTSRISHLGSSKDIEATSYCLRQLGAMIEAKDDDSVLVTGFSKQNDGGADEITLDAYESGSTLRFLIPLAAMSGKKIRFLGKPSLLSRPMGIYANIFAEQDLPFSQSGEGIVFHGPLQSGLYTIDGNVSSQFLSGLLFAGVQMDGLELAVLPPYQSRSYTSLTVDMLKTFGVHVSEPTDHAYRIDPGQSCSPRDLSVESDWSQAAFFLVLGALNSSLSLQGLNPDSLQGDRVIETIVRRAGGILQWSEEGILNVSPGKRHAFEADLADCPDLGPILCVLAACCPGTSRLIHASRLRYKECDRIAAMEEELSRWGVEISSDEDSMTIHGKESCTMDHPVVMDGHNDHRIVMAMSIFTLCQKTPGIIENAQAVTKSYPDFFEDLQKLGADIKLTRSSGAKEEA